MKRIALSLLSAFVSACTAPASPGLSLGSPAPPDERGALAANWKERIEQPYVYLEHRGDYRDLGEVMRRLFSEADAKGMEPVGPPFTLFYDDPGAVPREELRARVCIPLAERPDRTSPLEYDILPRAMVVYARVSGAYSEVARCYPALFSYLGSLGWRQGRPVREVYLLGPANPTIDDERWTEVQIPWGRAD